MELNSDAKEAIVMVHGIFTNLSLFYFSMAQELCKHYRVILYDLRGHGLSATPKQGYDLHTMSEDLLSILSARKLKKIHLLGYSFGGLIALYTALLHPKLVDKLVIIETPDLNDGQPRPLLEGYDRRRLNRYLKGLSQSTNLTAGKRKLEKTHEQVRFLFEQTTLPEDLLNDLDLFDRVAAAGLTQDTLLLYANITQCANAAEFLHQNIARSTLAFGDGDHNIPVQNPGWILGKMTPFLQS